MFKFQRAGAFAFVFFVIAAMASQARAAAALASGAKTSAAPTSTNPQIRQMQITFDPGTDLNVQGYKLDIGYDTSKVFLVGGSISFIDPFVNNANTGSDNGTGLITGITSSTNRASTVPGDVNLFTATFGWLDTTALDTPASFQFGDLTNNGTNFITGVDPNPAITTNDFNYQFSGTGPTQIQTTSFSAAITPEPSMGMAALMGLVVAIFCRRPRALKSQI